MKANNEFRLQSVLNLKASTVDMLEVEFARLKGDHERETRMLQALRVAEQQEMEALSEQQSGKLDCEDIKMRQRYLKLLQEDVIEQALRAEVAKLQMESKREELLETLKEYKTIQKLRERHVAEQAKEMGRREARMVDDLVSTRYVREGRKDYA